jgi:hypothetical protein
MSVKVLSEINACSTLVDTTCQCGAHVAKGGMLFDLTFRDYEGYCTDGYECCETCRSGIGLLFEMESNLHALSYDHDAEIARREDEEAAWRLECKRQEGQERADRLRRERKACATARRAHWVDKVNSAFARVA